MTSKSVLPTPDGDIAFGVYRVARMLVAARGGPAALHAAATRLPACKTLRDIIGDGTDRSARPRN